MVAARNDATPINAANANVRSTATTNNARHPVMKKLCLVMAGAAFLPLAACSAPQSDEASLATAFLDEIKTHCGEAFSGTVVSDDAVDADFAAQTLIMHVRHCDDAGVRIPFFVGDDRSRTWVITPTQNGLRLKHDHRHEDGSEDAVTQYGGDTGPDSISRLGDGLRAEFPVDDFSIEMFGREGLTASVTNIWAMEIDADNLFAYELRRENRFFRVEFDLSEPVDQPPAPWGATD